MAWKYQMPAIVLIDKEISEDTFNLDESVLEKVTGKRGKLWDKKGEYKRYLDTSDGVSPLAFPGEDEAVVKATSYEHDEFGITTEESESDIKKMQEKRLRKDKNLEEEIKNLESVKVFGNKNSDKALVVFGSNKGIAAELGKELNLRVIQPLIFQPFPKEKMEEALSGVKKVFTVEINATAQLAQLLNSQGIKVAGSILKYTGRPFFIEELREELNKKIQ